MKRSDHTPSSDLQPKYQKKKFKNIEEQFQQLNIQQEEKFPEQSKSNPDSVEHDSDFQDVYEQDTDPTPQQQQEEYQNYISTFQKKPKNPPQQQVNLFRKHKLKETQEFVYENSAYQAFHRCNAQWPCLSLDILLPQRKDITCTSPSFAYNLKTQPTLASHQYPITSYIVSGSQAQKSKQNKIYVMKWSKLYKTKNDQQLDSDSDQGDNDAGSDPVLYSETIPHFGAINRIKSMAGSPIIACFSDQAEINFYDVSKYLKLLDEREASLKQSYKRKDIKPRLGSFQMKSEGYALDFSKDKPGLLAVGDCLGNIQIFYPKDQNLSCWLKDKDLSIQKHGGSVEDIAFCSKVPHAFGSVSVDGSLRIWDIRDLKKQQLNIDAHQCDVNVLSWSEKNQFYIATGGDDGNFKIWDIRNLNKPQGDIKWHDGAITSIAWGPNSDSVLAVSSEDDKVSLWDFAMEAEEGSQKIYDENGEAVPQQLMFVHAGQKSVKQLKFHPCYNDVLVTTSSDGFNLFKPNFKDMDQEEEEQKILETVIEQEDTASESMK